jgi:hypothetical protein
MQVVDLDNYRDAPFINHMGRMFGSTRFMAPEEPSSARELMSGPPSSRWAVRFSNSLRRAQKA